jgi:hypothetical protein
MSLSWVYEAATMTDLHRGMTMSLVEASADKLDVISTVDVQRHNVIAAADSMEWEFDFKSMWLTKSRWTMMVRQYLEGEDLQAWIDLCTTRIGRKGRGTAVLRTKMVKPRGGAATGHTNKETRRWGSCMLSLSYKAIPHPTITLHSRTSYLGYIGALDLSVAWMAGRYLAHELGLRVEDLRFVWMIESIQWHNFKSLAFLLNNPDEDVRRRYRRLMVKPLSRLEPDEVEQLKHSPALELSRRWLRKVMKEDAEGKTYGDMTYNTYRRIRRRWHTEVLGYDRAQMFEGWSYYKKGPKEGEKKEFFKAYNPLPSVTIAGLDFSPIGLPFGKTYGAEFDGTLDELEDDDDE